MAIISFPVERVTGIIESNDYSNLKNFIAICDDNRTLEFYAGIAEECQENGFLNPGEFEKLTEQIRTRRLENARPKEKPAAIPEKPGLYCYTPEMGEQKPKCQIEAERSYYGRHYHIITPLQLKGRGITFDRVLESKNLSKSAQYRLGWREYTVTERAFEKLQEQYTISQELLLD